MKSMDLVLGLKLHLCISAESKQSPKPAEADGKIPIGYNDASI